MQFGGALEFDCIIVGAGSAGGVLANRLTGRQDATIALIEAGGVDLNFLIHMPAGYGKTANEPGDGLLYVRGQPADFDRWANLGAIGWG